MPELQGQNVASKEEAIVAQALHDLGYDYVYQYAWNGGRLVRGGQVIDFLVIKAPKNVPLFVHGEYWHKGVMAPEEDLKMLELQTEAKYWAPPVIIWGSECETVEQAKNILSFRLGI